MTRTWTQMARTALDGVRVWRDALRRLRLGEHDLGFSAVDFMVLCLLLDLDETGHVVSGDQRLAAVLGEVWSADNDPPLRPRVFAAPAGGRHLRLIRLGEIGALPADDATRVVYGLGRGISLSDVPADARGGGLRPLSTASPATWQCGLALFVPEGGEAPASELIAKLGQAMRGEWIDPLALYERVQQLAARANGPDRGGIGDADGRLDRIAELEQELASLKRTALVSQHLRLVEAAQRARDRP